MSRKTAQHEVTKTERHEEPPLSKKRRPLGRGAVPKLSNMKRFIMLVPWVRAVSDPLFL